MDTPQWVVDTASNVPEIMMSENYTFRKANKEDLRGIAEYYRTFWGSDISIRSTNPEYYEWKCYQNPFSSGEIWLAMDGSAIVGMTSMTPKRIMILGKIMAAAETGDNFTHPDYQRRGIFTTLFKVAREYIIDSKISFIYGTPNHLALPPYEKRLDCAQVPITVRSLAKLLYPKRLLEAKLGFAALASILSPFLAITSRAMLKVGLMCINKREIFVRQEPTFPDDIDTLWQRASRNYDVILVRTKEYLQWRYVTNPDTYSILIARDKHGVILGYLITKFGFIDGEPVGYLCDFLAEDDPDVFKKLLAVAMEEFDRRKTSAVFTWTIRGSFYDRILLRLGFLPRGRIPIICYKSETGKEVLNRACKWHFTIGDSDNI